MENIFSNDLSATRLGRLVVAAFFFGNGVTPGIACRTLLMCNPYWDPMIKYTIHGWYHTWGSEVERGRRIYYNVKTGIVLDLNHELSSHTLTGRYNPSHHRRHVR